MLNFSALIRAAEARQISLKNMPDFVWLQATKIAALVKLATTKGEFTFTINEKLLDEVAELLTHRGYTFEQTQDPVLTTAWKTTISW